MSPDVTSLALSHLNEVGFDEPDALPRVHATMPALGWYGSPFGGHETLGPEFAASLRPFYAWANRAPGTMSVQLRNTPA